MVFDDHERIGESVVKRQKRSQSVQEFPSRSSLTTKSQPDSDMPWWLSESPVCIQKPHGPELSKTESLDAERTKRQEIKTPIRSEASAPASLLQFCQREAPQAARCEPVEAASAPALQLSKQPVRDLQPASSAAANRAPAACGDTVRQQPRDEQAPPLKPPRMSSLKSLIISLGLNDVRAT